MDEYNSELQEIYNQTDAISNADDAVEEVVEVATEEVATPADEAASEDVETVEEANDVAEEATEEADDTEEASIEDSFDDLLEDIPSNEAILNAHKRIPQATKDALVEFADGWRNTKAQIDSVGGEEGIKLLTPLSSVLTKAEITESDSYDALAPLLVTNPTAMVEVLKYAAEGVLFNTDPAFKVMAEQGDKVLQNRFGEGYNAERIEKLVALEQGGYIDSDADFDTLKAQGVDSDLFQTQQAKLAEASTRITELENLVKNPHLIEQKSAQQVNAQKELETELTTRVSQSVTPFRERGRWGEASPLTQLAMRDVLNTLKDSPDYKEAAKLVSQYGNLKQGESIPFPVEAKLSNLVRQAKGKFGELVLAINKERRVIDESSTNTEVAKKVKETVPKAELMEPSRYYDNGIPIDPDIARLRAVRDAAIAAAG